MRYKGIVKVYREYGSELRSTGSGNSRMQYGGTEEERQAKPPGKLLEVEVVANAQDGLVKKINAMLATLDDDE